jgi:hypothetical protein
MNGITPPDKYHERHVHVIERIDAWGHARSKCGKIITGLSEDEPTCKICMMTKRGEHESIDAAIPLNKA